MAPLYRDGHRTARGKVRQAARTRERTAAPAPAPGRDYHRGPKKVSLLLGIDTSPPPRAGKPWWLRPRRWARRSAWCVPAVPWGSCAGPACIGAVPGPLRPSTPHLRPATAAQTHRRGARHRLRTKTSTAPAHRSLDQLARRGQNRTRRASKATLISTPRCLISVDTFRRCISSASWTATPYASTPIRWSVARTSSLSRA